MTLHEIEHEILRPMGEPRIHAAIVCASTSCPSLLREPFRAEHLDAQLDRTTRRWLASPAKGVRIEREARRVTLSPILDWFEEDFQAAGGGLEFVAAHVPDDDDAWLSAHLDDLQLRFFDYDWSLNDVRDPAARDS